MLALEKKDPCMLEETRCSAYSCPDTGQMKSSCLSILVDQDPRLS